MKSPLLHPFRGRGLTVPQIAALTGLAEATVYRRIRLGRPIEGPHKFGPEPKRYDFRGQLLTAPEIAERTGFSVSHVRRRISGTTFLEGEAARAGFGEPPAGSVLLTFGNITDSISGWARRTGIPRHIISYRMGFPGWTVASILTTPAEAKPKRYSHAGETRTLNQWAALTGIPYNTLKTRINRGWTISRTLTMPCLDHRGRKLWRDNRHAIHRMTLAFRVLCQSPAQPAQYQRPQHNRDSGCGNVFQRTDGELPEHVCPLQIDLGEVSGKKVVVANARACQVAIPASPEADHLCGKAHENPQIRLAFNRDKQCSDTLRTSPLNGREIHHHPGGYPRTLTGDRLTGGGSVPHDLQELQHNNSGKGGRHADPHR